MTRQSKVMMAASAGLVALSALAAAVSWGRRTAAPRPLVGIVLTLTVDTFLIRKPVPAVWRPGPFAEALAARLAHVPGLGVTIGGGPGADTDFRLDGEGTLSDGRLVLTPHLRHRGEAAPVWSATFLRPDAADSSLVRDLASDVAEALYGHLTRQSNAGARP